MFHVSKSKARASHEAMDGMYGWAGSMAGWDGWMDGMAGVAGGVFEHK